MFGFTEAFEKFNKSVMQVVKAMRELFATYQVMTRPEQSFPVLFPNTITAFPQSKTQPWLSAPKRSSKGFKSQKVRSNRRKAKKKSQLIKRCSST